MDRRREAENEETDLKQNPVAQINIEERGREKKNVRQQQKASYTRRKAHINQHFCPKVSIGLKHLFQYVSYLFPRRLLPTVQR